MGGWLAFCLETALVRPLLKPPSPASSPSPPPPHNAPETTTPPHPPKPTPPPHPQGDDYILYCHPSKQKVPRSDRLRGWYHEVLRRAREEGTVVGLSTLFDSYFEGGR